MLRTKKIQCMLKPYEFELLKKAAARVDLNISDYIRTLVLEQIQKLEKV